MNSELLPLSRYGSGFYLQARAQLNAPPEVDPEPRARIWSFKRQSSRQSTPRSPVEGTAAKFDMVDPER